MTYYKPRKLVTLNAEGADQLANLAAPQNDPIADTLQGTAPVQAWDTVLPNLPDVGQVDNEIIAAGGKSNTILMSVSDKEMLKTLMVSIGENGNWYIGAEDTGVTAEGTDPTAVIRPTGTYVAPAYTFDENTRELVVGSGGVYVVTDGLTNRVYQFITTTTNSMAVPTDSVAVGINYLGELTSVNSASTAIGYTLAPIVYFDSEGADFPADTVPDILYSITSVQGELTELLVEAKEYVDAAIAQVEADLAITEAAASNASDAAVTASNAASGAEASASQAATSAGEASTSASSAASLASESNTNAVAAAQEAAASAASATAAANSANSSESSATAAASSASNAASSESTVAQDAAQVAQDRQVVADNTQTVANNTQQVSLDTAQVAQDKQYVQGIIDSFALKIFQSPTDGGLTEIQTHTVGGSEVYEVRKVSDDSLATIYSDKAGVTEIVQNGTDNVSGSDGVVGFFIADGAYYIEVGSVQSNFSVNVLRQDLANPDKGAAMVSLLHGTAEALNEAYPENTVGRSIGTQRALSSSERTSVMVQAEGASFVNGLYVRGDGSDDRMWIGFNLNGEWGYEFRLLKDPDGMFIVRGSQANALLAGTPTWATNITGDFNYSSEPNVWTSQIGAKFDLPFIGSGLVFKSYTDNRGGLWRFIIDGDVGNPIDISTFSTVSADPAIGVIHPVISGLVDGQHTAEVEFIGDDPDNPPSGGVSRGWLFYREPKHISQHTGYGVTDGARLMGLTGAANIMSGSSIPDFAINARPAGAGVNGDWIPSHSHTGACRNIKTKITIDGVSVGDDTTVLLDIQQCSCVIVEHEYDAYSTYDTEGSYKLWSGVLTKKFDVNGLHISHRIEVTTTTRVASGYFAPMVPVLGNEIDMAVYNSGYRKEILPVPAEVDHPVLMAPSSMLFYNSSRKSGIAYQVDSIVDALSIFDKPLVEGEVFLQQRADGLAKAYWRKWNEEDLQTGERFAISARFFPLAGIDFSRF